MKFLINLIVAVTYLVTQIPPSSCTQNNRQKRFLIVPPTSPTRHQLISGIGIPLGLPHESVTTGYVLKAQYFLPVSINDLQFDWVFPQKFVSVSTNLGKRSIPDNQLPPPPVPPPPYANSTEYIDPLTGEHVEKYDGFVEEIDLKTINDGIDIEVDYTKNFVWRTKYVQDDVVRNDQSRWSLYKIFEGILNNNHLNGRECLKRVICEAATIKFGYENGILGDLVHVMLSPSTTSELYSHETDEEFDRAEELGKKQKPCDFHYPMCHVSLIDIFSKIF